MQGNWLLAFVACVTSFATAQNAGRITGTVLNEDGQVADNATICMSVASGSSTSINCSIFTDNSGQFQIDKVKFGSYGLFASMRRKGIRSKTRVPERRSHLQRRIRHRM